MLEPGQEIRLEDLLLAIESVAREPDQLLFGDPQRARIIQLLAQFVLVDRAFERDVVRTSAWRACIACSIRSL
jgi:hypothetical protein